MTTGTESEVTEQLEYAYVDFRADGPVTAHHLMLLWNTLIWNLQPKKLDRVQRGKPYVPDPNRRWDFAAALGLYEPCPDSHWQRLYMESSLQFPFMVHQALWEPFCDKETGKLASAPEGQLGFSILSKIPDLIHEQGLDHRQETFFRAAMGLREHTPQYTCPSLHINLAAPIVVERDLDGGLHSPQGPAGVWADGTTVYYWRGIPSPAEWFPLVTKTWLDARPGCPTLLPRKLGHKLPTAQEALTNTNLEHRRVACDILGWKAIGEQLIAEGRKPVIIDEDPDPEIGTLMRINFPPPPGAWQQRSEEQTFLKVRCGTGREFWLIVPPDMRTARQAVAWTYGLSPEEYKPEVRT